MFSHPINLGCSNHCMTCAVVKYHSTFFNNDLQGGSGCLVKLQGPNEKFLSYSTLCAIVKLALESSERSQKYVVGQEWMQTLWLRKPKAPQGRCVLLWAVIPTANSQVVFSWMFPSYQTISALCCNEYIFSSLHLSFQAKWSSKF